MERNSLNEIAGSELEPQTYNDPDQFRLLEAETIIFDKFDEVVRRKEHVEPEKNLMLAILEEGISCFQKQLFARSRKGKNMFHEAEAWILQRDTDRIFSFECICETLGISASYLRAGLIAWKNRQLQRLNKNIAYDIGGNVDVSTVTTVPIPVT